MFSVPNIDPSLPEGPRAPDYILHTAKGCDKNLALGRYGYLVSVQAETRAADLDRQLATLKQQLDVDRSRASQSVAHVAELERQVATLRQQLEAEQAKSAQGSARVQELQAQLASASKTAVRIFSACAAAMLMTCIGFLIVMICWHLLCIGIAT